MSVGKRHKMSGANSVKTGLAALKCALWHSWMPAAVCFNDWATKNVKKTKKIYNLQFAMQIMPTLAQLAVKTVKIK